MFASTDLDNWQLKLNQHFSEILIIKTTDGELTLTVIQSSNYSLKSQTLQTTN